MPATPKYNSLLNNSVFIFLNRLFINLATLLVMYFYAHRLSQDDYGHYQSFWAQLNVFNAIAGLGITIFVITYEPKKLLALFLGFKKKNFLFYLLFLIACGLILGMLQYQNNLKTLYVIIFLVGFAFANIADALLIVLRRFRYLISINIIYSVAFFLIHYLFLFRTFNLNHLLLSLLPLLFFKFTSAGIIVLNWIKANKDVVAEVSEADTSAMRSLWRHLYIYDIMQISFLWLDKFIISLLLSSEQTAIYINGTLNIPFLPILFSALVSSAMIHLTQNNSKESALNLMNSLGKILSSVAFPLCLFLLFFSKEFILFFFSDKYEASVPIFICSVLILPARAYAHTIVLQHKEKGRIINKGAIMDICIALALMYPLYLLMGLPGVALSFVISTYVQVIYYLVQTKSILGVSATALLPLMNWIKKGVGFFLLSAILYFVLPAYLPPTPRLFVAGGIIGLTSLLVLFGELSAIKKTDKTPKSELDRAEK